jgi:hypothetical protein
MILHPIRYIIPFDITPSTRMGIYEIDVKNHIYLRYLEIKKTKRNE